MPTFRRMFRAQDRYGVAMIGMTASFLLMGLVESGRLARILTGAVLYATLWFILYTTGATRRVLQIAIFAIVISAIITATQGFVLTETNPSASYFVLGVMALATPLFVVARLLQHPIITLETLVGAVVVYLLIGLAFTFILIGGSLIADEDMISSAVPHTNDYFYVSFITLTTVGYGDVTPTTNWSRVILIMEAIIGQLFLAIVIARFASLFSGRSKTAEGAPVDDGLTLEALPIEQLDMDRDGEADG